MFYKKEKLPLHFYPQRKKSSSMTDVVVFNNAEI